MLMMMMLLVVDDGGWLKKLVRETVDRQRNVAMQQVVKERKRKEKINFPFCKNFTMTFVSSSSSL